jgi:hypothetical protein
MHLSCEVQDKRRKAKAKAKPKVKKERKAPHAACII